MKLTPNISLCAIVSLLGIFAAPASGALVAYWSFDDCSAVDNSGNGYDGTIIGSLDCLAGVSGNAFYFDNSSGNYVSVANSEQLSPTNMTITAWIKAEEIPQDYASSHIVSTYDGNSTVAKGYSLFYRPNTEPNLFGIQLSDGVDTNSLEAVHPDQACSKWIFLAAVFEEREQYGNKAELYLNANLVGRALADGFHGSEQSIVNLTIGTAAHVPTCLIINSKA